MIINNLLTAGSSGDLQRISQATVSQIIKRVFISLANNLNNFVKFGAREEEQRRTIMLFNERYGFPSTAGAVDGTHIPIQNPGGANGEVFRNRKSVFSLNVQVCINL
jgi:hypothetical protein